MRKLALGLVCGVCLATCGSPSASVYVGGAGAFDASARVVWAGALRQQRFVVHLSCPDGRCRFALQIGDGALDGDPRSARGSGRS